MSSSFDLVTKYYDWLKDNTYVYDLPNGWAEIATPFLDRHNDGMTIYAKIDGENIKLSDDGYIISDLKSDGFLMSSKKRKDMLKTFLTSYGLQLESDALVMNTTKADYPASKHLFLQAMLAINDMFMLSTTNAKSLFTDDVASYFDKNNIIATPSFIAKGSTGLEFNFHFQIAGKTSEILINTFNSISSGTLAVFLFDWLDIKAARQTRAKKEVRGLAVINDEKEVDPKYLDALTAKGTDYVLFSKRNEPQSLDKFKAA